MTDGSKIHRLMVRCFGESSGERSHKWLRDLTGKCHVADLNEHERQEVYKKLQSISSRWTPVRKEVWMKVEKGRKNNLAAEIIQAQEKLITDACQVILSELKTAYPNVNLRLRTSRTEDQNYIIICFIGSDSRSLASLLKLDTCSYLKCLDNLQHIKKCIRQLLSMSRPHFIYQLRAKYSHVSEEEADRLWRAAHAQSSLSV